MSPLLWAARHTSKKFLSKKEERTDIVWTISVCHRWSSIISNQDNSNKSYSYIVGILSMTVFFETETRETIRHQIIVVLMFWKSHITMTHTSAILISDFTSEKIKIWGVELHQAYKVVTNSIRIKI